MKPGHDPVEDQAIVDTPASTYLRKFSTEIGALARSSSSVIDAGGGVEHHDGLVFSSAFPVVVTAFLLEQLGRRWSSDQGGQESGRSEKKSCP